MTIGLTVRALAAATVLGSGLAIGAGGVEKWTAGTAFAAAPRCLNTQLTMKPIAVDGAMGHISEMFRIHNTAARPCTLYGYPGAMLLDSSFHTMPTHVSRAPWPAGGPGPSLVTLSRGHDAYFVLMWEHMSPTATPCSTSRYLKVWAPNDFRAVVVNAAIDACGGNLTVSPVATKKFWKCTGSCGVRPTADTRRFLPA